MYRRTAPIYTAAALALLLTGCGSDPAAEQAPQPAPDTSATAVHDSAAPAAVEAMGAKTVVNALKAAGLPVTAIAEQGENTDPNDKLGRPGGYTSRASADVPGGDKDGEKYGIDRGLVVEVFTTVEDAGARSKYIQETLKTMQILGTEYHYRGKDKRILVRISGKVKPSQAKKFEIAVAAL